MQDRTGDTDSNRAVEDALAREEVVANRSKGTRGGGSRSGEISSGEKSAAADTAGVGELAEGAGDPLKAMESAVRGHESSVKVPAVVERRVMNGLTITELEMMPKMEELRRLEEIPVYGTTNIEPAVIGAIAGVAAEAIEGVASLGATSLRRTIGERIGGAERRARGVEVEVGRREVILDINLRMIYGYSIPKAVIQVRQHVADRLLNLCGLEAKEINVRVVGIEFPPRMPGRVQ